MRSYRISLSQQPNHFPTRVTYQETCAWDAPLWAPTGSSWLPGTHGTPSRSAGTLPGLDPGWGHSCPGSWGSAPLLLLWLLPSVSSAQLALSFPSICFTGLIILAETALSRHLLCVCSGAQLGPTLCGPMDRSLPGSSVYGIFQTRILTWLPFPTPGYLPDPRIEPASFPSPALAGRFFITDTIWEA